MKMLKRIIAWVLIIWILVAFLGMTICAVTGSPQFVKFLSQSIMIPVIAYVFVMLAGMSQKKGSDFGKYVYTIKHIEEPDFGCEGRPENEDIVLKVLLQDKATKQVETRMLPETYLNMSNMQVGDTVQDVGGTLVKISEEI